MAVFHYRKKRYSLPRSYNELTGDQLVGIAGILTADLDEEMARLQALQILMSKSKFWFGLVSNDVKHRLMPYVKWVFAANTLTKQLIPFYDDMFGPAGDFDNMKMNEWNACEIYYDAMANSDDEDETQEALNTFCAVLYRRGKKNYNLEIDSDGDAREDFNANKLDYYKKKTARWPANVKQAIVLWFDGCRQDIKERYDLFNTLSKNGSDQQPGMFDVIRELAGKRYGTFDKVENMYVHHAMLELCALKKEADELKALYPNL